MDSTNFQIKVKSETNLEGEATDEANNLLRNGILVETSKGLICMSLNDALSLDLNLSVDDLRNVAAKLISQQNIVGHPPKLSHSLNCDSDGFSSECSDISTTTSGSTVQSPFKSLPPLLSDRIINKFEPEISITESKIPFTTDDVKATDKIGIDPVIEPVITIAPLKISIDVVKPKKNRGGWPKGRKRKPEVLNLPPKAPATGYTLYLNEQRKHFKDSNLAFHEITKVIGNRWSSLTLEEKKPYLEKAEEDKKRYREELKQYRQSDAYRAYLTKKRKKRLQNNVMSESDMDATDDFDEEDNEELYCRTCDQWFHNLHNKREHLQGKQHLQSVAGNITRALNSEAEAAATTSTFSTSLDESSLDGMPNVRLSGNAAGTSSGDVCDAMTHLATLVTKREKEIKTLKNRQQEFMSQQQALCNQLHLLNERHKKLQRDLLLLKEKEKETESKVMNLWQVPSWFIINNVSSSDSVTDCNESTE
ncbi:high mobility group protein 20A-like [Diabrotica virgifera virgifera]|uniref:HMG box domain-containing protein n=1 Tax=Diabrotica virgifera virgifera TaxID=50390 RepID=A0ABM5IBA4_DIAVI|nr:high mobility group protein 20A-like [Diabrotica virgifera virgifera]